MLYVILSLVLLYFLLPPFVGLSDLHFHRKPKGGKLRVACVGDSITTAVDLDYSFVELPKNENDPLEEAAAELEKAAKRIAELENKLAEIRAIAE